MVTNDNLTKPYIVYTTKQYSKQLQSLMISALYE